MNKYKKSCLVVTSWICKTFHIQLFRFPSFQISRFSHSPAMVASYIYLYRRTSISSKLNSFNFMKHSFSCHNMNKILIKTGRYFLRQFEAIFCSEEKLGKSFIKNSWRIILRTRVIKYFLSCKLNIYLGCVAFTRRIAFIIWRKECYEPCRSSGT